MEVKDFLRISVVVTVFRYKCREAKSHGVLF